MLMESAPIRPTAIDLAAAAITTGDPGIVLTEPGVPMRGWSCILVHTSICEREDSAQRCHIIIQSDGSLAYTNLWKRQLSGASVANAEFNSSAVAIIIAGKTPSDAQKATLMRLRQALRERFNISESRDYDHCDIEETPCGRMQ